MEEKSHKYNIKFDDPGDIDTLEVSYWRVFLRTEKCFLQLCKCIFNIWTWWAIPL